MSSLQRASRHTQASDGSCMRSLHIPKTNFQVWSRCAGSPFQPYTYEGQKLIPGQANNVLMCAACPSCRLHTLPFPHRASIKASTMACWLA